MRHAAAGIALGIDQHALGAALAQHQLELVLSGAALQVVGAFAGKSADVAHRVADRARQLGDALRKRLAAIDLRRRNIPGK